MQERICQALVQPALRYHAFTALWSVHFQLSQLTNLIKLQITDLWQRPHSQVLDRLEIGEKTSAFLNFINNLPPPLIELKVNWPFPRLQQCVNEVLWSVYVSTVFIIALLPSLTLKVFCRMLHPIAGREEADSESKLCVNVKTHSLPSVMHFHQLTFADILWLPIYSTVYNATNQYCKYWEWTKQKWKTRIVL